MASLEKIVKKLTEKPYRLDMGAGKLAKWWNCTRDEIYEAKKLAKMALGHALKKAPKVLVFDIETSPVMAYVWQTQVWRAQVSEDKVISEWFMLTWSAKWLFDGKVMSARLTRDEALAEDDSRIVKGLWDLLNEADIVITHNGDRFDIPNMNTRFIVNGLAPTSPYQSIDTNRIARRQFGFTHNNLNALARVFGFDSKISTDFKLWKRCIDGEVQALKEMEEYNRRDVTLLEEVYMKLRPWIKGHPNLALYMEAETETCPNCGGTHLIEKGNYYTNVSRYDVVQCEECGAYSRRRTHNLPKSIRENVLQGNLR